MYESEKSKFGTSEQILSFALCEDNPTDIENCTNFLSTCATELNLRITLKVYQSAEE